MNTSAKPSLIGFSQKRKSLLLSLSADFSNFRQFLSHNLSSSTALIIYILGAMTGKASTGRKPTCAVALDINLEELKRLNGLESLREYIVKEKCFPTHVSPTSNTP